MSNEGSASLNSFDLDGHSSDEFEVGEILDLAQDAFAKADVGHVRAEVAELLETFGINLDEACDDYRSFLLRYFKTK
ncbi:MULTISPECIES: hypothetical protein [unclassified Bradyrhizobium]